MIQLIVYKKIENPKDAQNLQAYLTELANNLDIATLKLLAEKSRKKGINTLVKQFAHLV